MFPGNWAATVKFCIFGRTGMAGGGGRGGGGGIIEFVKSWHYRIIREMNFSYSQD